MMNYSNIKFLFILFMSAFLSCYSEKIDLSFYKNNNQQIYKEFTEAKRDGSYEVVSYKNGVREGRYIKYTVNNNISIEGEYKNGFKNGEWVYFITSINSMCKKEIYENGNLISTTYYNGCPRF